MLPGQDTKPMGLSHSTRTVRLSTALGPDALGIRQIVFREALGQPFSPKNAAVAEQPDIDLDALVRTNLTVAIEALTGRKSRFVNAFVTEAALTGVEERLYGVSLTGAPWFWLLTLSQTCRIFEDMTAPEIVATVLDEQNLGRYRLDLEGTYPALRYCVQYNESDFAFISRLLEREGIYHYFEHTNGAHELVLTDSTGRLQPLPGYERLPFRSATQRQREAERVLQWQPKRSLRPTRVALADYRPDQPTADMLAETAIARHHRAAGCEVYA
jgi:type VI secretion system secreted protein VgrG